MAERIRELTESPRTAGHRPGACFLPKCCRLGQSCRLGRCISPGIAVRDAGAFRLDDLTKKAQGRQPHVESAALLLQLGGSFRRSLGNKGSSSAPGPDNFASLLHPPLPNFLLGASCSPVSSP